MHKAAAALEQGPPKLMPSWGCSTPTEQPVQRHVGLGVGTGSEDLWWPQPLGTGCSRGRWHQGQGGKGFFLTCLGFCCWGLPRSSLGLWGTESKGVRAFSPLQFLGRGGGQNLPAE